SPNTGTVKGLALGSTNIVASVTPSSGPPVKGSALVTVDAATLLSVVVQPSPVSVGSGESVQLTATANFSDGSSPDVTAQASWTVPQGQNIAIVNMGLLTGVMMGNTTVQASYSNQPGVPAKFSDPVTVTVLLNFPDLGTADSQAFANAKSRVNQLLTAFERRGNLSD